MIAVTVLLSLIVLILGMLFLLLSRMSADLEKGVEALSSLNFHFHQVLPYLKGMPVLDQIEGSLESIRHSTACLAEAHPNGYRPAPSSARPAGSAQAD